MRIRRGTQVLLLFLGVFLLLASAVPAATPAKKSDAVEITLDFQDVELVDLISTISELTGKNFVYDEAVRGKVNIISPRPVSIDEAYQLFTTVLNVKGFTIVPSGRINKILPTRNAKEENLPISEGRGLGEQYITRLIDLKNLDASIVVDTILRPLVPKTSYVVAYVPSNTVIITDSAANIDRLVKLLDKLDTTLSGDAMEIVPLQFAEAEETADLVMQVIEGSAPAKTVSRRKAAATSRIKTLGEVIPYSRTNKLMLVGDKKFIARAKSIIVQLDEKADLNRSGMQVYYLENADAEGLATTLNQILTGVSQDIKKDPTAPGAKPFGKVTVTADNATNALIINASAEDYNGIKDLIAQLDIKRKQVFVEALILEVTMDALLELGTSLQVAGTPGFENVVFGTSNNNAGNSPKLAPIPNISSTLASAVSGILVGGMSNLVSVNIGGETVTIPALSALIQLSQSNNDVNVLSAPRLLTSDNEEAEIVVGSNVPIITSKSKDNDGNQINSVERKDVALTLRFTPQITEGNLVRLKIYQEISDVASTSQTVGTVDEVGPTFNTRRLSNSIIAQDGKTVVLGGLFQTNREEIRTKVPLLGDIPLLGYLFRSKSEQETKTSLLIFITPRVIRDSDDMEKITKENQRSLGLFTSEKGSEEFFEKVRSGQDSATDVPAQPLTPAEGKD